MAVAAKSNSSSHEKEYFNWLVFNNDFGTLFSDRTSENNIQDIQIFIKTFYISKRKIKVKNRLFSTLSPKKQVILLCLQKLLFYINALLQKMFTKNYFFFLMHYFKKCSVTMSMLICKWVALNDFGPSENKKNWKLVSSRYLRPKQNFILFRTPSYDFTKLLCLTTKFINKINIFKKFSSQFEIFDHLENNDIKN